MKKTVLAALPLTLLALVVPAAAQARATTYRATVAPLGASASAHGGGVRGKAKLRDGARKDRLTLSVRGLPRGERYTWSLRSAAAGEDACAGEAVAAFAYRALRRGKSSSRARRFAVKPGSAYAVVVTGADGRDVACGEFAAKAGARKKGGGGKADDDGAIEDEDELGDDDPFGGDDDGSVGEDDEPESDDSGEDLDDDEPLDDDSDDDDL